MWELDYKEGWSPKNWCFWTVALEKTLESPLDCKDIKPVNPKGNQPWIFTGRTDAEAPILWPLDANSQLGGKDPDVGKDWGQEEKGAIKDEMVVWYHGLNGLSKLWQIVKYRKAWCNVVHGVPRRWTRLNNWITTNFDQGGALALHQSLSILCTQSQQLVSIHLGPPGPRGSAQGGEGPWWAEAGGVQGTCDIGRASVIGPRERLREDVVSGLLLIKPHGSEWDWSGFANPHCPARSMYSSLHCSLSTYSMQALGWEPSVCWGWDQPWPQFGGGERETPVSPWWGCAWAVEAHGDSEELY